MRAVVGVLICMLVSCELLAQSAPEMPAFGSDEPPAKSDWMQIGSYEWLKGEMLEMFDGVVQFDSADLDVKTYKWYDIRQLRTARVMNVGLLNGDVVSGKVVVIGEKVTVFGDTKIELARSQILSISPSLTKRALKWAGKLSAGATVLRGNVDEIDANVKGYLKRRTVADRITIDFISNLNASSGTRTSDNRRITAGWDHFITDRFFLKPIAAEFYRDPFQNISSRATVGAGAGYQFIDRPKTRWEVSGGLAFQRTNYVNISTDDAGAEQTPQTGAISASTKYEHDFTKIVEMDYEYTFNITNEASGRYNHHMILAVETDWTDILDFDVTFVWDRTQIPQANGNGVVPKQDDFRLVIGIGLEF